MTSFRFIHAADIHLDSPLRGLSEQDGYVAERIRGAPREAFRQLIGTAIEEKVDFLIIAGDLYDGTWRDYNTGLFFIQQMGRLNEAGIPTYLLYGNHDAESQLTKRLTLPENVSVFPSRRPKTLRFEHLDVVLHGQSFGKRAETRNLARSYPDPVDGAFNIGILHTALDGREGHENYAPCSLPDLVNKGYDYWALGHVHCAEIVHERPHIVFPGNLQGRHVREEGAKGAVLVTVEDGEVGDVKWHYCDVVRWTTLPVDVTGATNFPDVVGRLRGAIENAVTNETDARLMACRVVVQGNTEIHEQLLVAENELVAEARSAALGAGDGVAWIERVQVAAQPLKDAPSEGTIAELQRILQDAEHDPGLLQQLENDAGKLVSLLPSELRSSVEDKALKAAIDRDYQALIQEVTPYLYARLVGNRR